MPQEKSPKMTAAVRRALEIQRLADELQAAQELISELRDENRQLREHLSSNKLGERAQQALRSRSTWRPS